MAVFKCECCGADLFVEEGTEVICGSCGAKQIALSDEKHAASSKNKPKDRTHAVLQRGKKNRDQIRKLVMLALFTAVAYLSIYIINFRVQFLTFDVKNVFITIAAMIYGPIAGVVISLVSALLEFLLFSTTGFYGFIMNFLSSASFAAVAALVYRGRRTHASSYLSLISATLVSTAVMLIANLIITPYYMVGGSVSAVAEMIPTLLFPFNLLKCLVNAALVLVFYKPISLILHRAKMLPKEKMQTRYFNRHTVITIVAALVLIAVSLVVFFWILGGDITFGH